MRVVLHESTRLAYAADSLAGLSVGDALGAQYFMVGRRVDEAARSARITHAHPEGVAGAIAIAVGASTATSGRLTGQRPKPGPFIDAILAQTPKSTVRSGVAKAGRMLHLPWDEVAYELGNGRLVTAQDTVPFTVWVAAKHLDDYAEAVRTCIRAGGDIDTTAAIAGGMVAAFTGTDGIPDEWRSARELLPTWLNETI